MVELHRMYHHHLQQITSGIQTSPQLVAIAQYLQSVSDPREVLRQNATQFCQILNIPIDLDPSSINAQNSEGYNILELLFEQWIGPATSSLSATPTVIPPHSSSMYGTPPPTPNTDQDTSVLQTVDYLNIHHHQTASAYEHAYHQHQHHHHHHTLHHSHHPHHHHQSAQDPYGQPSDQSAALFCQQHATLGTSTSMMNPAELEPQSSTVNQSIPVQQKNPQSSHLPTNRIISGTITQPVVSTATTILSSKESFSAIGTTAVGRAIVQSDHPLSPSSSAIDVTCSCPPENNAMVTSTIRPPPVPELPGCNSNCDASPEVISNASPSTGLSYYGNNKESAAVGNQLSCSNEVYPESCEYKLDENRSEKQSPRHYNSGQTDGNLCCSGQLSRSRDRPPNSNADAPPSFQLTDVDDNEADDCNDVGIHVVKQEDEVNIQLKKNRPMIIETDEFIEKQGLNHIHVTSAKNFRISSSDGQDDVKLHEVPEVEQEEAIGLRKEVLDKPSPEQSENSALFSKVPCTTPPKRSRDLVSFKFDELFSTLTFEQKVELLKGLVDSSELLVTIAGLLRESDGIQEVEVPLTSFKSIMIEFLTHCPATIFLYFGASIIQSFPYFNTRVTLQSTCSQCAAASTTPLSNDDSPPSSSPGILGFDTTSMIEGLRNLLFLKLAEALRSAGVTEKHAEATSDFPVIAEFDQEVQVRQQGALVSTAASKATSSSTESSDDEVEKPLALRRSKRHVSSVLHPILDHQRSKRRKLSDSDSAWEPPARELRHPYQTEDQGDSERTPLPTEQMTSDVVTAVTTSSVDDASLSYQIGGNNAAKAVTSISYLVPLLSALCSNDPSLAVEVSDIMNTQLPLPCVQQFNQYRLKTRKSRGRWVADASNNHGSTGGIPSSYNNDIKVDLKLALEPTTGDPLLLQQGGKTITQAMKPVSERDAEILTMPNHIITKGGVILPPADSVLYLSKVVGVVWDKIHNSWVVNYTLLGRRYFQHFPAKKFGFLEGRKLAIELRLAKDREKALVEGAVRGGGRRAQGPSWKAGTPPRRKRRRRKMDDTYANNESLINEHASGEGDGKAETRDELTPVAPLAEDNFHHGRLQHMETSKGIDPCNPMTIEFDESNLSTVSPSIITSSLNHTAVDASPVLGSLSTASTGSTTPVVCSSASTVLATTNFPPSPPSTLLSALPSIFSGSQDGEGRGGTANKSSTSFGLRSDNDPMKSSELQLSPELQLSSSGTGKSSTSNVSAADLQADPSSNRKITKTPSNVDVSQLSLPTEVSHTTTSLPDASTVIQPAVGSSTRIPILMSLQTTPGQVSRGALNPTATMIATASQMNGIGAIHQANLGTPPPVNHLQHHLLSQHAVAVAALQHQQQPNTNQQPLFTSDHQTPTATSHQQRPRHVQTLESSRTTLHSHRHHHPHDHVVQLIHHSHQYPVHHTHHLQSPQQYP